MMGVGDWRRGDVVERRGRVRGVAEGEGVVEVEVEV